MSTPDLIELQALVKKWRKQARALRANQDFEAAIVRENDADELENLLDPNPFAKRSDYGARPPTKQE